MPLPHPAAPMAPHPPAPGDRRALYRCPACGASRRFVAALLRGRRVLCRGDGAEVETVEPVEERA